VDNNEALIKMKNRMMQFASFKSAELDDILNNFELSHAKSKSIITQQGSIARKVYFIVKGSMRFYYNYNGNEVTGAIFMDNEFATPHDSFFSQSPTRYSLQAIEDTMMFELSFNKYNELRQKYPALTDLTFKVLEKALSVTLTNKSRLLMMTHEERYAKISEDKPEWILRIPDHMLASYLGITPTSLSRIKKRLNS
jgi:CRP-like cAMP-binding protein